MVTQIGNNGLGNVRVELIYHPPCVSHAEREFARDYMCTNAAPFDPTVCLRGREDKSESFLTSIRAYTMIVGYLAPWGVARDGHDLGIRSRVPSDE